MVTRSRTLRRPVERPAATFAIAAVLWALPATTLALSAPRPPALPAATVSLKEPVREILMADLDGNGRDDPVVVSGDRDGCHLGRLVAASGGLAIELLRAGG